MAAYTLIVSGQSFTAEIVMVYVLPMWSYTHCFVIPVVISYWKNAVPAEAVNGRRRKAKSRTVFMVAPE